MNIQNTFNRDKNLRKLIHSSKYRVKDPAHLCDKLLRKALSAKAKGERPSINLKNLFVSIGDLAGLRLIHLHTTQFKAIDEAIRDVLNEESTYEIAEGPIANTWDDEYREFFKTIGVATTSRKTLYTSVHYVVDTRSRLGIRCEVQVRTLMEEVWGEVSHLINYPHETTSIACQDQLKVLARLTSSGTRLVDCIFRSQEEYEELISKSKK